MVTFQICTRYILVYSLHYHIQLGGGGVLYWDRHHPNAFPLVPSAKQDGPDEAKISVT